MKNLTVRSLTDVSQLDGGKTYMDLPILHKGTLDQCVVAFCEMFCGYKFVKDASLFGRYYAHEDNGDCLFIV